MARIDYSDPAKHNDRTRELLGKNRNANIFRMMAHSPSYLSQYCRLAARSAPRRTRSGGAGTGDHADRHLVRSALRDRCAQAYRQERWRHRRTERGAGELASRDLLQRVQRAALAFTEEIVKLNKPTDATFNAIKSKLTPARWSNCSSPSASTS
jgi:hypothetical protein